MPRILEGDTPNDHIKYDEMQKAFIISRNKNGKRDAVRMFPNTPHHFKDNRGIHYQVSLHNEPGQPAILYRRHVENQQWVYEHSINLNSNEGPYWQNSAANNLNQINSQFPPGKCETDPGRWQQSTSGNNPQPEIEIFKNSTELLSYNVENKKLYFKTKTANDSNFLNAQEVPLPATYPVVLEKGQREQDKSRYYQLHFSRLPPDDLDGVRRYIDENDNSWHYESFLDTADGIGREWTPIYDEVDMYFPWPVEKQYPMVIKQNVGAEDNKLSDLQIEHIASILESPILELKKSCNTRDQFKNCLKYLIEERSEIPPNLSSETSQRLKDAKYYLTEEGLHNTKINSSATFQGHFATIGETKQYMLSWLKQALNQVEPDYTYNLPNEYNNDYWKIPADPELAGRERNLQEEKEINETLQRICKVQKLHTTEIKDNATLEDLEQASKKLEKLLDPQLNDDTPFVQRIQPFLTTLASHVTERIDSFSTLSNMPDPVGLQAKFLLPLYQKVNEKIAERYRANSPNPKQFQMLRVDQWNGVQRHATHADFVNEQFKNRHAIFVIPDNFADAELDRTHLHQRQARGGLAGPMAPRLAGGNAQAPVYDLCTLGIPTGGQFVGSNEEAKTKVQEHFADLYRQIHLGRTIVVPCNQDGPAFGTGIFAEDPLTRDVLKQFIADEFAKLKRFCEGGPLPNEYQTAWNNPGQPFSLPGEPDRLPQAVIAPPAPAPQQDEQGIEGKDFLNPGFRTRFKEWFEEKHLGALAEHRDEANGSRSLRGTLSTGVGVIIYSDRMVLDPAASPTGEVFRNSMREMIEMYKDAYKPGNPPPTTPLGTPEQKIIISELLEAAGIPVKKPAQPADAPAPAPPPPPAPRNN